MDKLERRRKMFEARFSETESWEHLELIRKRQQIELDKDDRYRESILQDIATDERMLFVAFEHVKTNAGKAGIDLESVFAYEHIGVHFRNRELRQQVRDGTYEALPLLAIKILKPEGGDREIHIPAVEDRILMKSLSLGIETIVKHHFENLPVHGFIPGRGPHSAIEALLNSPIAAEANQVAHLDVVKFFDRITQGITMEKTGGYTTDKRALALIRTWLQAGAMKGDIYVPSHEGVPQGSPLSPTLANIYLEGFDRIMAAVAARLGAFYLRYADNLLFLTRKDPSEMNEIAEGELAKIGLAAKNKIPGPGWIDIREPWKFLGFAIHKMDAGFSTQPDPARVRDQVAKLRKRRERAEGQIRRAAIGFARYYEVGTTDLSEGVRRSEDPIAALEDWLRRREVTNG